MARKKLDMTEEERRIYNNKMHRKQSKARKEKAIKEAYKEIVCIVAQAVETVGWDKTELLLGPDEDMLNKVADYLIKEDKFKITFGNKTGIKINRKENK